MKFKLIIFSVIVLNFQFLFSQIVTSSPTYPTENDSIVIYFDATQPGAEALLNYSGTIYAHTGVTTNVGKWRYVKGTWGVNPTQPALSNIGPNLYKLTIGNPRQFYKITDTTEHITALDFVFRSTDATKQTSPDIFYLIYQPGYTLTLINPVISNNYNDPQRSPIFINKTDTVNIFVKAVAIGTKNSAITLFINGVQKLKTQADSLSYQVLASQDLSNGANKIVIIGTDTANVTDTLSLSLMINLSINKQPLQPGIQLGINYNSSSSVTLALFAPYKKFVYLLGDFNDWKVDPNYFMNEDSVTADSVVWWITLNNLTAGQEYAFQYLVDGQLRIADPFTHKVLDSYNDQYINSSPPGNIVYPNLKSYPSGKTSEIVSVLQTDQPQYNWITTNFKKPDKSNLVIYELHVRDFVSTHWFRTVEDTLNYLKQLGINAIELMPVMEFEGNDSWGYNPDFHLALDKYYGTPYAFKSLIDKAHSMGIAVILDIVLNHAYGQNPLVRLYWDSINNRTAANNPWFNVVSPNQYYSYGYDFNHESPQTKYYVDRVTSYWINEFHIDGYRFDFAKGFTNTPGEGTPYDSQRISIMQRIANKIWAIDSTSFLILENFVDNSEEIVESNFGFLSWGNMNYNYQQASMGFSSGWDFTWGSYKARGWNNPSLVTYMESHDEERLMYKNITYGNSSGNYNIKDLATALNRIKLCAAFFYTIPGPKMLWQFGELGYDYTINYNGRTGDKPIRWDYENDPRRMSLYKVTGALIKLKENYNVFKTSNFTLNLTGNVKSISLYGSSLNVVAVGNFSVTSQTSNASFPYTGTWYDYFTGNAVDITSSGFQLAPGEFHIFTSSKLPVPDTAVVTGINDERSAEVKSYKLDQNFPNPFNPSTTINYQISNAGLVKLKVFDILGREVATLVNKYESAGKYSATLNGSQLSSGIYFYKIQADNFTSIKKMILLK